MFTFVGTSRGHLCNSTAFLLYYLHFDNYHHFHFRHTHTHYRSLDFVRHNIHPLTPMVIINHPLSASSIYYDPTLGGISVNAGSIISVFVINSITEISLRNCMGSTNTRGHQNPTAILFMHFSHCRSKYCYTADI